MLENPVGHKVKVMVGCLVLSLAAGCRPEQQPSVSAVWPSFDGERAFREVEALVTNYSPRDAGTPGGERAARYLADRLAALGIEVRIDTFCDNTPAGPKTFHNVIARVPGASDRWIVLGSHFDTMPGIPDFQGANDSGSSTGVLIEMARLAAGVRDEKGRLPLKKGLVFAFFDGEEGIANYIPGDGLHGSRRYVAELRRTGRLRNVEEMILLDMVGDQHLDFTLPFNVSPRLLKELLRAARKAGTRDFFHLQRDIVITDDHVPFIEAGISAIVLIDFHYGSAPGLNDYWHTPADNLDHISPESLEITGRTLLHLLMCLDPPPNP